MIGIPRRADVEMVWPCTAIKKIPQESSTDDIRKEEKSRQNKSERGYSSMQYVTTEIVSL